METDTTDTFDQFKYLYEEHNYTPVGISNTYTRTSRIGYSDAMPLGDANMFSPDLAKASVGLAFAAYNKDQINALVEKLKFSPVFDNSASFDVTNNLTIDDDDHVAYTIAKKTIKYGGKTYVICGDTNSSGWKYNSGYKMYYFTFDGIAAKEMGDELYVTVYTTDGTQVSETKTDSIRDHVARNISKWTGEARTMGVDMLDYGAAAQKYFKYDDENPANAGMDDYQQYATQSVTMTDNRVKGTNYVGSTLKLDSSIVPGLCFLNE